MIKRAKEVKNVVDHKAKYTDWSQRTDIKAELKVDLVILPAENSYPPVDCGGKGQGEMGAGCKS